MRQGKVRDLSLLFIAIIDAVVYKDLTASQQQYWNGFGSSPPCTPRTAPTPPAPAPIPRYRVMGKSLRGYVAYIVYAGHDIGVFYNWCVFSIT